jgi:hypothetical protein
MVKNIYLYKMVQQEVEQKIKNKGFRYQVAILINKHLC